MGFNELNEIEIERLALLAEECGEVIQIIGKVLRHGYQSSNPFDESGTTNQELLEKELGDLTLAIEMMWPDLDVNSVRYWRNEKRKKIEQYLHHQVPELWHRIDEATTT